MSDLVQIPDFASGAYTLDSVNSAAQSCVNLYPEMVEAINRRRLVSTPGLQLRVTLPASPIRAIWGGDGIVYVVAGGNLYQLASNWTYTLLNPGSPMAVDANQALVFPLANGGAVGVMSGGYLYIAGGSFRQQTYDVASGSGPVLASHLTQMDGYFIFVIPSSRMVGWNHTPNDVSDFNAADFGSKMSYPDNVQAVLNDHEDLWVFGYQTTEIWRDSGAAPPNPPFQRVPGLYIQEGTVARFTPTSVANGVAWLGGDTRGNSVAWFAQGYVPQRISTHAVEIAWNSYSSVSDAVAWVEVRNGHQFWWITFPTGGATWVYDFTEGLWHQRAYGSGLAQHRAIAHTYMWNEHIVGDYANGNIYTLDYANFGSVGGGQGTDNGVAITRQRAFPFLSDNLDYKSCAKLRLIGQYFNEGAHSGDPTLGPDPLTTLAWSDDGGHNFTGEHTMYPLVAPSYNPTTNCFPLGVERRRLGRFRQRVFRVTTSSPYEVAWDAAAIQVV